MNINDLKPTDYTRVGAPADSGKPLNINDLPKESYSKVGGTDALMSVGSAALNNALGAGRFILGGGFSVAKDMASSITKVGATAGAGLLQAAGDIGGKNVQQTTQPIIDSMTKDNPDMLQPYTNMPSFLGGLLDAGSWAIPIGKAAEGAEVAGKGIINAVKGTAKKAVTSGVGKFAAAQGGAAALKAKGQGSGDEQAISQGVGTYLANLAFIGVASKAGKAIGSWAKTLSSTKSGQILADRASGVLESFQSGATPEMIAQSPKTLVTSLNSASEQLSKGLTEFYNEATTKTMKQYDPNGMKGLISDTYANLKPTRMGIANEFKKVFDYTMKSDDPAAQSFLKFMDGMGAKAKGLETTSVDNATKDIKKIQTTMQAAGHSTADIYKAIQDYTAKLASGAKQKTLAPGLQDYIDEIQTRVLNPLNSGRNLSASVLNDFIHYIKPNGTGAEKALGNQIQDQLYNMFGDSMKVNDKATHEVWSNAKEAFRQLGNTLDSKWAGLIHDVNHPQQFSDEIIGGDYFKTPQDTKEMIKLFGAENHEQIQDSIMRRLFEIAQATHKAVVGAGSPEGLAKAGKEVAQVFDNFLLKSEKASDGSVRLMSAQRTEFLQNARNTLSGDLWSFAKNAEKETGIDSKSLESLYRVVTKGASTMETVLKNPSELVGEISKMPIEDLRVVKSLYTPEQWQGVGAQILKGVVEKSRTIFSKKVTSDSAEKFLTYIDKIGGGNHEQVFNELFGDSPEVKKGIDTLISSLEGIQKLDQNSGSMLRGVAHGISALIFGTLHHPILATGEARKMVGQFANMTNKEIEQEVTRQLEETGKLPQSLWKSLIASLANSGTLIKAGGRASGEGVKNILREQQNQ